jgi:serine protease Do
MPAAPAARAFLAATLALAPLAGAPRPPDCPSRYADALAAMKPSARAREARAAGWVFCLRATAVYESVSYGRGGKLRRQYHRKVRHGTGFAFRQDGARWLVVTNVHVFDFPDVTGDGNDLEGIPPGARKVRDEIRIVSSEAEPDSPGQTMLSVVVADPALDVAVLASPRPLPLIPYAFGRSADLHVGNAVLARGYPLGAFAALNAGTVIAAGQRDRDRGWDHEDFAVDALLNLGSSGSPVLAVSCATGEPELVGVYHAGYRGAQGLNVVIAVDGLRGLLDDLRAPRRPVPAAEPPADPRALAAALREPVTFQFGGRFIRAERSGDALRFALLDPAWPLSAREDTVLVDPGRSGAAPGTAGELRDALRAQLALTLAYRAAEAGGGASRFLLDRLATRSKEREEEQADLLAALDAGSPGLPGFTDSGESAPAGRASEGSDPGSDGSLRVLRAHR